MSSREQFEAWYLENWGHTEDDHETLFERDPDSDEEYYRLGVRMSHQAWQAATNAMEAKCSAMAADNEKAMEAMRQADEVVKRAHSKFAALADENMALRSAIENGMAAPETPATDAFLAEVRAQGGKVTLPTGYLVRPGHPINEAERGVMIPKDNGPWLSRHDVEHALRVAGIRINGED